MKFRSCKKHLEVTTKSLLPLPPAPSSPPTRRSQRLTTPPSISPSPTPSTHFDEFETDEMSTTQSSALETRLNKAVAEVISLNSSEWTPAAKALHAKISKTKKGLRNLEAKLAAAIDAKVAEGDRMAKILRRGPHYGPYGPENGKAFMTFRMRRIARLFKAKPEMLEYLKTQALSVSYNKGYKTKIKLYEDIAKDPEKTLAAVEFLCSNGEACGLLEEGTEFTLRETLDAMDWYADNKHANVCGIYEEYRDVPTKEMFEDEKGRGRSQPQGLDN